MLTHEQRVFVEQAREVIRNLPEAKDRVSSMLIFLDGLCPFCGNTETPCACVARPHYGSAVSADQS